LHSCDDGNRPRCHRCPPFAGPVSPEYKFPARSLRPPAASETVTSFNERAKQKPTVPGLNEGDDRRAGLRQLLKGHFWNVLPAADRLARRARIMSRASA